MLASCPSEFNRELERGEGGTETGLVDLPQSKNHLEKERGELITGEAVLLGLEDLRLIQVAIGVEHFLLQ